MINRRGMFAGLAALFAMFLPRKVHANALVRGATLKPVTLDSRPSPKLRVWKVGSLEHRIYPTEKAIQKLAEMLEKWDGQSDLDLIWGPELEVQQFDLGPGEKTMDVIVEPDGVQVEGKKVILRKPIVTIRPE